MTTETRMPDYGWNYVWMVPLACLLAATWPHGVAAATDQPIPSPIAMADASSTKAQPVAGAGTGPAAGERSGEHSWDACSLVTRTEVETAIGRPVLAPRNEEVANLATCSFGDPEAPVINGRSLAQLVSIDVLTGSDVAYFAGAAAQARDSFATGRKNGASAQTVSGLGDDAYWDETFNALHVLKGRYNMTLTVAADAGDLEVA